MLEPGMKHTKEETVTMEKSAKVAGSGQLEVYATPAMIALMEGCSHDCIAAELEEGAGTVGTYVQVKHVASTPIGMKVRCESELVKVDGRFLTFSVKAFDEAGLIGEGTHERCIINKEKFQKKTDSKK